MESLVSKGADKGQTPAPQQGVLGRVGFCLGRIFLRLSSGIVILKFMGSNKYILASPLCM